MYMADQRGPIEISPSFHFVVLQTRWRWVGQWWFWWWRQSGGQVEVWFRSVCWQRWLGNGGVSKVREWLETAKSGRWRKILPSCPLLLFPLVLSSPLLASCFLLPPATFPPLLTSHSWGWAYFYSSLLLQTPAPSYTWQMLRREESVWKVGYHSQDLCPLSPTCSLLNQLLLRKTKLNFIFKVRVSLEYVPSEISLWMCGGHIYCFVVFYFFRSPCLAYAGFELMILPS